MKNIIILFATIFSFNSALAEASKSYTTTAKLPQDRQMWPPIELELTKDIAVVEGEFVEAKEILSVIQGNYRKITYLVRYKVVKKHKKYSHDEIIFIVKDSWPTVESGIKVKRIGFLFRTGNKTFYMQQDAKCRYTAYFNILTHS